MTNSTAKRVNQYGEITGREALNGG